MRLPELVRDPAQVFDSLFVPALFAYWGPRVAAAAGIQTGHRVLDVGCGTGVLACAAAERTGSDGVVVGLDPSPQMLAVARRKPCRVEWREGRAEALPFTDGSFDAVVSQAAITFFDPPETALAEMLRVLRPGGRLAVHAFDHLEHATAYHTLAVQLARLFGERYRDAMHPPFALGDRDALRNLVAAAGGSDVVVSTEPGPVRFASIEAMLSAEQACVWTLGGLLNDAQFATLREAARTSLQPFVQPDGSVVFDCPGHIVTATKPAVGRSGPL
ncbi:MAG: class I SAM-dependent methyltransferase [Vicinamibacterales bacterium]